MSGYHLLPDGRLVLVREKRQRRGFRPLARGDAEALRNVGAILRRALEEARRTRAEKEARP